MFKWQLIPFFSETSKCRGLYLPILPDRWSSKTNRCLYNWLTSCVKCGFLWLPSPQDLIPHLAHRKRWFECCIMMLTPRNAGNYRWFWNRTKWQIFCASTKTQSTIWSAGAIYPHFGLENAGGSDERIYPFLQTIIHKKSRKHSKSPQGIASCIPWGHIFVYPSRPNSQSTETSSILASTGSS